MADKPRVKAPKQRSAAPSSGSNSRLLAIGAGVAGLVIGVAVVAAAMGFVGGGSGITNTADIRAKLKNSGCTLTVAPALEGVHSITDPSKTSPKWNTDPPTSGPHYAVPAVFGVGSSRVDLQACKLEYSIVSPK